MISKSTLRFDQFGMAASTICAIHCILVAVAPAALAATGFGALLGHEAEWGLSITAGSLALLAAIAGLRIHHSLMIFATLIAGVTMLIASRFLEEWGAHMLGTTTAVISSFCLILGHLHNLRASRCCGTCS